MKIVYPITDAFIDHLKAEANHPDVKNYLLGGSTIEAFLGDIASGKLIAIGLEKGNWKGVATLELQGTQAELAMYAPEHSREAVDVVSKLAEHLHLDKVYVKVRAERFKGWERYRKDQWMRIGNTWGMKYAGMLGDPLVDEQKWYLLYVRSVKNGKR